MEKVFEHFTITILKLNKLVQRIKQFESNKYGLKSIHIMCGYYLNEHPDGLTAGELVKLTLEDKAAISRALKSMRDKGFVTYDPYKHNSPVKLTEQGKRLADFISERSDLAVKAVSGRFTEQERDFFYTALGSIADNLEQYYKNLLGDTEE